ncbi:MAG TPA: aspartyl protease family protein [Planctomycetota bacterium]|nr:aspartyl protease family protein [Planctomycetota bacterium]
MRRLAVVILAGCATVATPSTREPAASPAWEVVAARWAGNWIFVDVEVNDSRESLLLDTGCDITILDPGLVSRLGVPTEERASPPLESSSGWSEAQRRTYARASLRVGRLTQDADVLVLPLGELSRMFGEPIDGILGFQMWAGVSLRIDYPHHAVQIADRELPLPDGKTVFATAKGQARMRLDLPGGQSATVVIDSGSAAYFVVPEKMEQALSFRVRPRVTSYVSTWEGMTPRRTGRLADPIRVGRYVVEEPLVSFASGETGVMGTRVLQNFALTFDFAGSRVAFEREGAEPIRIPSLRGIGAGLEGESGSWKVLYVLEGGPAERAGLRAGDRVVAINGQSPDLFGPEAMKAAGVRVEVQRAGASRTFDVPVELLVE